MQRLVNITLRFINLTLIPQGVSKVSQYCTKYFVAEALLKAAVHGLVVREELLLLPRQGRRPRCVLVTSIF
jgi:hypothetical protein